MAILGPTCAWKTDVGVILARRLNGEIISCDSMQVYRGLDIGTAKASPMLRRTIPHHLIDILDIAEPYDANQFVQRAKGAIRSVSEAGKLPILVGGTGLYAKALIYGLPLQPADPQVAAAVCRQAATAEGLRMLHDELAQADASLAATLRPNPRRLMRAVEILRIAGGNAAHRPAVSTETAANRHESSSHDQTPEFAQSLIIPDAGIQKSRIIRRVDDMLANGWIDEARAVIADGLLNTPTARQALGYRDIAEYLSGSLAGLERLRERLIARTVQYARRQRTWFRHQHPGAQIVAVEDPSLTAKTLAEAVLRDIERGGFLR